MFHTRFPGDNAQEMHILYREGWTVCPQQGILANTPWLAGDVSTGNAATAAIWQTSSAPFQRGYVGACAVGSLCRHRRWSEQLMA